MGWKCECGCEVADRPHPTIAACPKCGERGKFTEVIPPDPPPPPPTP